jgi:uncharacterized protein
MNHLRFAFTFLICLSWTVSAPSISSAAERDPHHTLLFFNRSAGFQHPVVTVTNGKPCYVETILRPICEKHNWKLVSTKDGSVFTPENIAKFDAFLFYTTGDLTAEKQADGNMPIDGGKPMSAEGKKAFLEAIHKGKGFVGFHCASDTFHSEGDDKSKRYITQSADKRDPYINMLGGEFITHCTQQSTTMTVVDPKFPGAGKLRRGFDMFEEWYSLKNFADDLHVLLVNETKDMHDKCYERPPYPATWIRNYGKGRVFYTSMGHREDVWTRPEFQNLVVGGIKWAVGDVDADTSPNIDRVTPKANTIPPK